MNIWQEETAETIKNLGKNWMFSLHVYCLKTVFIFVCFCVCWHRRYIYIYFVMVNKDWLSIDSFIFTI